MRMPPEGDEGNGARAHGGGFSPVTRMTFEGEGDEARVHSGGFSPVTRMNPEGDEGQAHGGGFSPVTTFMTPDGDETYDSVVGTPRSSRRGAAAADVGSVEMTMTMTPRRLLSSGIPHTQAAAAAAGDGRQQRCHRTITSPTTGTSSAGSSVSSSSADQSQSDAFMMVDDLCGPDTPSWGMTGGGAASRGVAGGGEASGAATGGGAVSGGVTGGGAAPGGSQRLPAGDVQPGDSPNRATHPDARDHAEPQSPQSPQAPVTQAVAHKPWELKMSEPSSLRPVSVSPTASSSSAESPVARGSAGRLPPLPLKPPGLSRAVPHSLHAIHNPLFDAVAPSPQQQGNGRLPTTVVDLDDDFHIDESEFGDQVEYMRRR